MKTTLLNFKNVLFSACLLLCNFTMFNAQPTFQWAKQMGGNATSYSDYGKAVTTDAFGNVYTTGIFAGVCDFDPGVGTYTMVNAGVSSNPNAYISKLDASGNFVWAKQITSNAPCFGRAITIDASGNILITGSFQLTADFDPSTGIFNLNSLGNNDIFVLKLDPSGNFLWAEGMGGVGDDNGYSIASDASGNVFSTGYYSGTADFDPGAATYTLGTFGSNNSTYISKLNSSGNFVWAKNFGGFVGNPSITGFGIKLDGLGNIYTAGVFAGQIDFDPGPGPFTITAINADTFIAKLDASGNFLWAKSVDRKSVV